MRAYDRRAGAVAELAPADCGFAYRSSAFKADPARWVVLSVAFDLPGGGVSQPVRYGELAGALGVAPGATAPVVAVREAVEQAERIAGLNIENVWAGFSAGGLVSDDIMVGMIKDQLETNKECTNGCVVSRVAVLPPPLSPSAPTQVSPIGRLRVVCVYSGSRTENATNFP